MPILYGLCIRKELCFAQHFGVKCVFWRSCWCLQVIAPGAARQYAPRQRAYTWGSCAPRAAAPCDRQTDRQTDGSRYRLLPSTAVHNKQFDVMLARFRLMDSQLAFHIIKYATRITQKQKQMTHEYITIPTSEKHEQICFMGKEIRRDAHNTRAESLIAERTCCCVLRSPPEKDVN